MTIKMTSKSMKQKQKKKKRLVVSIRCSSYFCALFSYRLLFGLSAYVSTLGTSPGIKSLTGCLSSV